MQWKEKPGTSGDEIMKRLFCVKKPNGRVVQLDDIPHSLGYDITHKDGAYFQSKHHAKVLRDLLGEGYYVSHGPDHIGKHGHTSVPKMRRQPK